MKHQEVFKHNVAVAVHIKNTMTSQMKINKIVVRYSNSME